MLKSEKNVQEHLMNTIQQVHEKMTLRNHPLKGKDTAFKNDYLTLLTAVAGADRDFDPKELQYLKNLAAGLKLQTIELYHNLCAKMTVTSLEKKIRNVKRDEAELYLLLDALILASIDSPITDPEAQYIGLLCDCLSITQIDAKEICTLARAVLQRDIRSLQDYLKGHQPLNSEKVHGAYLINFISLVQLQDMCKASNCKQHTAESETTTKKKKR
ncbi:MAG: hypothetical protein PHO32_02475 [Candidatus Cloacimonetes bacterium]|nr:hypothetical protein [Candidatus Cloacimonadota bacterium]